MKRMEKSLNIKGDRVYLRPITEGDTDMVVEWRNRKEVVNNFIYRKPISCEEHMNWLATKVNTGEVHQFIVCMNEDDKPVGCVYLQHFDEDKKKAETGIFMSDESAKGKGIGTEAVKLLMSYAYELLGIHKLVAKVLAYNVASIKLHENAGYMQEACLKDELIIDGKYEDLLLFGAINPVK